MSATALFCHQRYCFICVSVRPDGSVSSMAALQAGDVSRTAQASDCALILHATVVLPRPRPALIFIRGKPEPRGVSAEISGLICSAFGWRRWKQTKTPEAPFKQMSSDFWTQQLHEREESLTPLAKMDAGTRQTVLRRPQREVWFPTWAALKPFLGKKPYPQVCFIQLQVVCAPQL